ncbi:MAG: DUF2914 domain-containing protein [Nitrospirota bacterium]|jgi:hypothetical protein
MRKVLVVLSLAALALAFLPQEARAFEVQRFVVARDVVDREPVGVSQSLPVTVGTVYAFLEAGSVEADTVVSFVWLHMGEELARVDIPLKESPRYRTWSSKRLGGRTGAWTVRLLDSQGEVLAETSFEVLPEPPR